MVRGCNGRATVHKPADRGKYGPERAVRRRRSARIPCTREFRCSVNEQTTRARCVAARRHAAKCLETQPAWRAGALAYRLHLSDSSGFKCGSAGQCRRLECALKACSSRRFFFRSAKSASRFHGGWLVSFVGRPAKGATFAGEVRLVSKLVVIGNGMVGQRFLESLPPGHRFEVTVLAEEARPAYDR